MLQIAGIFHGFFRSRGTGAATSVTGLFARIGRSAGLCLAFGLTLVATAAHAQTYTFKTVAGAFIGDGLPATNANVNAPIGLAFDAKGNFYVSEFRRHRIRKVTPSGVISTFAGTGAAGSSGNGGKATLATLNGPQAIAFDTAGNLYFADSNNNRVRKITPSGVITLVAGNGSSISSGDGGLAINAGLGHPYGVAVDAVGNVYFSEYINHRIRKVTPGGVISTVAGNGVPGFSGDGGAATTASLYNPAAIALDAGGNLYVADSQNHRIRQVTPGGVISTVAGNGSVSNPVAGPATQTSMPYPYGLGMDAGGNLYIGSAWCYLYKVVPAGTVSEVAGWDGLCDFDSDNIPAQLARVSVPEAIAMSNGDLYFADSDTHRVRRISNGMIDTVAGFGAYRGDGGPALDAVFSMTLGLDVDGSGNIYVADGYNNHRVRKITAAGTVTTVAGTGQFTSNGDGGLASSASLAYPMDTVVDAAGNLYIVERFGGSRVRKVTPGGVITTVAGSGASGYNGDGGLATSTKLNRPYRAAVDAAGNLFIADTSNHRIRKVTPAGIITTVAGNGIAGFSGDTGLATDASLNFPSGIVIDAAGNLYIADRGNYRIRKVAPDGTISTIAGNGTSAVSGDGGPAVNASLTAPTGIALDSSGNLFIASGALRKVASNGTISTIYGVGYSAYDVAIDNSDSIYIAVLGGRILKGVIAQPIPRKMSIW